jgi:hypothetical protein
VAAILDVAAPAHSSADVLLALDLAVDRVAAAERPPSVVLGDDLVALRCAIDRLEAVSADWSALAHREGVGAEDGATSTTAWLATRTGMRPGEVRRSIGAGQTAWLLPRLGAAWREGRVSAAAMRTIAGARVPGYDDELAACEDEFLSFAEQGDVPALAAMAKRFKNYARADGGAPPSAHDGLTLSNAYDGSWVLHGELSDSSAETVVTALDAYTPPPQPDDNRSAARRRADALVRICEVAMEHVGDDHPRGALPLVIYVVDHQSLEASVPGAVDGIFTGPIHPHDLQRALCDSTISRVVTGPDSLPLDVGRATRTVPAAIRRAVIARDRHCRWPGCDRRPGWCDTHHHRPWHLGGPTSLSNLYLLCRRHHHQLHAPGWSARWDGHALIVQRPDGKQINARPPPPMRDRE